MKQTVLYRHALWGAALALALLGPPAGSARAGFLLEFSGNTRTENLLGNLRDTINFAVLDRFSGPSNPGDVLGTGLADFDNLAQLGQGSRPFDTTARYLYLYQDVNSPTSTVTATITAYTAGDTRFSFVSSFAQWNLLFQDDRGVISTTNDFGADGAPFMPFAPANTGVTDPGVADGSGANLVPLSLTLSPTAFMGTYLGGLPRVGSAISTGLPRTSARSCTPTPPRRHRTSRRELTPFPRLSPNPAASACWGLA
jgi:hypothetical protein